MKYSFLLSVLFLSVLASSQQQSPAAERAAGSPPSQIREAWLRNFNTKNVDAILQLYAEDATLVSEAGTFQGREAIRPWIQTSIDQGSRLESIDAAQEKSSGTLAYGTGRSRRWIGSELHLGQYLIVMERAGDDWRIVQHFSMNVRP